MTKRKRARDENGHFLPRGQTSRERSRPDTPQDDDLTERIAKLPLLPGERIVDKDGKVVTRGEIVQVVAPPLPPPPRSAYTEEGAAWPKLLNRPERQHCEECGQELTYAWMHVGRASYHIGRCMRCCPEPPVIARDDDCRRSS